MWRWIDRFELAAAVEVVGQGGQVDAAAGVVQGEDRLENGLVRGAEEERFGLRGGRAAAPAFDARGARGDGGMGEDIEHDVDQSKS